MGWYAGPVHTLPEEKKELSRPDAALTRSGFALPLLAATAGMLLPSPAWAVQVHGGPEGFLVHQMAHLFLGVALVFLLHLLRKRPPGTGRPWQHLKISLLLFLLWDIDTTAIHWLADRLPDEAIITGATLAGDRILLPDSWLWLFYYAGSLDHLLYVPAAWFLALSLKGLGTAIAARQRQEQAAP